MKIESVCSTSVVELDVPEAGQADLEGDVVSLPQTILRRAVHLITEKGKFYFFYLPSECWETLFFSFFG